MVPRGHTSKLESPQRLVAFRRNSLAPPPAFSVVLTDRSGHVLRAELEAQIVLVLTNQRFGVIFTKDDDEHH